MSIEVHRAGRTFYSHFAVLLNQPGRELSSFLELPYWQAVVAAMFLRFQEVEGRRVSDYFSVANQTPGPFVLSTPERDRLRAEGHNDETIALFEKLQAQLQTSRNEANQANSPEGLSTLLVQRSGIPWAAWESAGQELLEAILPLQSSSIPELMRASEADSQTQRHSRSVARSLNIKSMSLATDFPITTATFGFSRSDYQPDACRLNAFPPDPDHGGRFPIFVDVVQADAILVRLDPEAVFQWLLENGCSPSLPSGQDREASVAGYFVQLLNDVSLRETLTVPEARLAFGLLHTMSHLLVRRASLLCGLEGASLSEYVLPKTLTIALYCNHRFGATIGALSALFEQSIAEWLTEVRSNQTCVYDPVCIERGGSCHACTHLSETSCRFFNLNLGRQFLFGGADSVVGEIRTGFLNFVPPRRDD